MTAHRRARHVFGWITARSRLVLLLGLAAIAGTAAFMPAIEKDTSADAFIDPDSPALLHRERVEEIFGLKDPIVAAVIAEDADGVFDPDSLALVEWLSDRIRRMPNVDPERVSSLATETNIVGTAEGIVVEEFFETDPDHFRAEMGTPARAAEIAAAIADFPLYRGSLVARDGGATVIVAELVDETEAEATYRRMLELIAEAPVPDGVAVHVAGEGAVSGYLQTYIDQDARRLNPVAAVIITLVLLAAFMSLRGAVLPNLVVVGTAAGAFGLMGLFGVDFYVITNGLVVNLIGIAVADSIHVFSQYYEEQQADPEADKRELVVRAMTAMWRPITLTTVTTVAGFLALAASSVMPPVAYFGLFGAVGVALAWVYSVTLLPAMMTLWPGKRLPRPFRRPGRPGRPEGARGGVMGRFGGAVLARPRTVLALGGLLVAAGAVGAAQVVVDDARIENFQSDEPLYRADKAINRVMDGTYNLDILIETAAPNGLHEPAVLARIEALQDWLVTLPGVNGTTSIVDYLKQLHRSVYENDPDYYRIPDDPLLIAQLFFLYNASADPTDFEEEVDTLYRRALVRANVDRGTYANNRVIVPAVERYLDETFDAEGVDGTVTGRVNVDYHWIDGIDRSSVLAVALSFAAVTATAMLVFRSAVAGGIAVLPVGIAVLVVYAAMGFGGIPLGVGTSMFAAIAIGLGVDFAIHTLDRIRQLTRREGITDAAIARMFPTTGRALLFNFVAIALGFGVLATSDVPPLVKFGSLVAVAVATAFLAAMTVVPALVRLLRPAALAPSSPAPDHARESAR
jgi:hypothetical protein